MAVLRWWFRKTSQFNNFIQTLLPQSGLWLHQWESKWIRETAVSCQILRVCMYVCLYMYTHMHIYVYRHVLFLENTLGINYTIKLSQYKEKRISEHFHQTVKKSFLFDNLFGKRRGLFFLFTHFIYLFIQIWYGDNFLFYFNPKIKISFFSHTDGKRLIISNKYTMQVVVIIMSYMQENKLH